jgi:anti-sigma-K factor RskA
MTEEELILSGKLELYVCGALPSEEISEVEDAIASYPKVKKEVEEIEASLVSLAETVAPPLPAMVWTSILNSIRNVRSINKSGTSTNWAAISGWAAAILCIGGIFWMLQQNNTLKEDIFITTTENTELKNKIELTEGKLTSATDLLAIIGSNDYNAITLPGNAAVAPDAFAKVYFNETEKIAYFDGTGLPKAPVGKVYQVWSLKLDPLTPTSVGLLGSMSENDTRIFKFENIPDPEAFGITLEPDGGSESPTLSQLYILGTVSP